MQTTRKPLNAHWQVSEAPNPAIPEHNRLSALPARVPGHVHLDLIAAGAIQDPFTRLGERGAWWVDETDWCYETKFESPAEPDGDMFVVFHGLDTVAEIVLNEVTIAHVDNMFIPHEFEVSAHLRRGEPNNLRILFRSALKIGRGRHEAWDAAGNVTVARNWDIWAERQFVRKSQYMFGWDWGPVIVSCGIWRPVEIVRVPVARITDWRSRCEFAEDGSATVHVDVDVERASKPVACPLTLKVDVGAHSASVAIADDETTGSVQIRIDNPKRWYPNGMDAEEGAGPHLYPIAMRIESNSAPVDKKSAHIGLRTIELLHEPDPDGNGEGFVFRVNGKDLFIKGANWIPADSMPARLNNEASDAVSSTGDDRVAKLIAMTRDAGMNMLRVWGGGLYESDHFYEQCDQNGILVWQDFPYACGYYPDDDEHQEIARIEATAAVRRIRNHASLALWCGNNENYMMLEGNWGGNRPGHMLGKYIYEDVLPAVVASEDPSTPYWISSPYGGASANSPDFGDQHNWSVWHGTSDWTHYRHNHTRFCSEFGFCSSCSLAAWETCLDPADKTPRSPVVRWHDKSRKGYDVYLGKVETHFPKARTLDDLVYTTQINQMEALKCGVEHYRRIKGRCWGTLIWQLEDCWPVQSWAFIDSALEPKALYFAMKSFHAPVHVSLVETESGMEAHVTNDLYEPISGKLTLTLETFAGEKIAVKQADATIDANASAFVGIVPKDELAARRHDAIVHARWESPGAVDENIQILGEPKDIDFGDPGISISVTDQDAETISVKLSAKTFAPYVWLLAGNIQGVFSDNFFHVRAGEAKEVLVKRTGEIPDAEALRKVLKVRTLGG